MQTQSPEPEDANISQTPKETDQRKLDRLAGDAAKQGSKTQQRYDKDHNIFTK